MRNARIRLACQPCSSDHIAYIVGHRVARLITNVDYEYVANETVLVAQLIRGEGTSAFRERCLLRRQRAAARCAVEYFIAVFHVVRAIRNSTEAIYVFKMIR